MAEDTTPPLTESDDTFHNESSRDNKPLRSLQSKESSRTYRKRDKESYGESYQDKLEYRKELKRSGTISRKSPPIEDHVREGRHDNQSRTQRDVSHHKQNITKSSNMSGRKTNHGVVKDYSRRADERKRRSHSRSPTNRPAKKGLYHSPHHSRHYSSKRSDEFRHDIYVNKKSNVNKLLKDLQSSSSSDSDKEDEVKENKVAIAQENEEVKEIAQKKTWKDILTSDSEDEEEHNVIEETNDVEENDNTDNDEPVVEMNNEEITPTELIKDDVIPSESMEIESPDDVPDDTDQSEDLLPKYLPALMGCRSVENYEWLNKIEEGTYGVVFRAKDKKTGEIVALKKLKMEKEREGFPITSLREINMLLKAKHENIVHVREIVVGSNMDKIFIVMDYIEHDLKSLMETMKQPFLEGEVKTLLIQLLKAIHHLHDNWILHRDLKTSNLLLSHKGILKVADFGLAREYGSPLKNYTPIVVTLWYRSPELLLGAKQYSTAVDMWSVGCIFAELLQHKPMFMGKSENDQLNQIFKELGTPNDSIWPGFSKLPVAKKVQFISQPLNNLRKRFPMITKNGFNLLNKFFAYDPLRRVSADEALIQDYFEESPLPVDPNMFPTWPAKSEITKKNIRPKSPTAPEGGAFLLNSKLKDDEINLTTIIQ